MLALSAFPHSRCLAGIQQLDLVRVRALGALHGRHPLYVLLPREDLIQVLRPWRRIHPHDLLHHHRFAVGLFRHAHRVAQVVTALVAVAHFPPHAPSGQVLVVRIVARQKVLLQFQRQTLRAARPHIPEPGVQPHAIGRADLVVPAPNGILHDARTQPRATAPAIVQQRGVLVYGEVDVDHATSYCATTGHSWCVMPSSRLPAVFLPHLVIALITRSTLPLLCRTPPT